MTSLQNNTRLLPEAHILTDLAWRAALVIVAAVAVVLELPAWVRAPLSLAAAAVTVMFVLRRYQGRGVIDRMLVTSGVVVAGLAALGFVLNLFPSGISSASWGVGIAVIELVALVALAVVRAPVIELRRRIRVPLSAVAWTLAVSAVLAGALVWSTASFTTTHVAPLALGAVASGDSMIVTVTSGQDEGPYDLYLVTKTGRTMITQGISVSPGSPASITIEAPVNAREVVQLVNSESGVPLRELILDTTEVSR